jgi:type IV secretory pathway ATPase VirB11/archaellum biosynthesis ATPase
MHDPDVEEIDVNSHRATVSYSDGRKEALGQLWDSADDLYALQRRLTLSMGVTESRLDEQSRWSRCKLRTARASSWCSVVQVEVGCPRNLASRYVGSRSIRSVSTGWLSVASFLNGWCRLEALVQAGMTILISGGPAPARRLC